MELKSVNKKENSQAQLVIEIDAASFQKALDKAYNQNKKSILVPGFRKGKAPRKIVEGMYGKSVFYEDAINILYPDVFPQALEESKLNTVGTPSVENLDVDDNGVLTLTMAVDLYPEVELGQYKGIEAYKPPVEVTDDEVNAELEKYRDRNARIVSVDRPIQEGDTAVLDFDGYVDGEQFEGGKGENYELKIGSGQFIPGFEDALIGVSAGEAKDVNVTFPEDYAAPLNGKPAVFKCFIHEVKETQKPELDDDFAIDLGSDNLEALKEDTKKKLVEAGEASSKNQFESNVMQQVSAGMKADIPNSMIESQLDKIVNDFGYQVQMYGMQLDDYMKMLGMDMNSLRQQYRPMAVAQVKSELAMAKIAEIEELTVSDEEIEAEYSRLAESYDMEVEKVKEYMDSEEVSYSLKLTKASELVIANAAATDKEPELTKEQQDEIAQVVAEAASAVDSAKAKEE